MMTSNEGPDKNVIIFQPPMCFTCDNARTAVKAFDEALTEVEEEASRSGHDTNSDITVPISILSDHYKHKLDSDEDDDDLGYEVSNKRRKIDYQDMD